MVNRAEQPFGHDGAGNNLAYFGGQERLKRREFLQKIAAGACIAATGIFTTKQYALPYATEKYQEIHDKYSSLGGPYTARAVVSEMGGREIDSEMLDELLGSDAAEIGGASLSVVTKEFQESPEAIAEYDLVLERDGPVFAKFDGLQGDDVSLTILRAVVDDEEEFLIPLVRDEAEQPSITVQLGELGAGGHKLALFDEHAATPTEAHEVIPHVTLESAGALRSVIDKHQPDIYLRDYGDMANNFPIRSYASVLVTDDGELVVVYTTECTDEDEVFFGKFGTSWQRLVETEGRPTDVDWIAAMRIQPSDGSIQELVICEPYHHPQAVEVDPDIATERIAVRIASSNNHVKIATDSSTLDRAKFRPRPIIHTYEGMKNAIKSTDASTARLSVCENDGEGKVNHGDPVDQAILEEYGLGPESCQN